MSTIRKILLAALVLGLIILIIVTWGSVASIIFTMGLILVGPAYLCGRFINNEEPSDFLDDENG